MNQNDELRKSAEQKLLRLNPSLNDLAFESKQAIQELELNIYNSVSADSHLAKQILYELQLHQIELEMQNEELRKIQIELDESKEKYYQLYNAAPIGYLTLSEKCLIIEANLTASNYFNISKRDLLNQPFTNFILFEDQDIFYLKRKSLTETYVKEEFEIRMTRLDGKIFLVQLIIVIIKIKDGDYNYNVIINDKTDGKN